MKDTKLSSISHIEFCIHTEDNRDGLERLLFSIAKHYPGARVLLADSARQLDRAYYKQLRAELSELGALNRMSIHHIGYQVGEARARNFLISQAEQKYLVFFRDTDEVTKETDLRLMSAVLDSNKNIGIVCGKAEGAEPKPTGKPMSVGRAAFTEVKNGTPFFMLKNDVTNYIRYNANSERPHTDFFNRMASVPFMTVYAPTISIKTDNEEAAKTTEGEGQTPNGPSTGNTPEPTVQNQGGGEPGGANSQTLGQDAPSQSSASGRAARRGGDRPPQGGGDK